jgi:hypothetical protein
MLAGVKDPAEILVGLGEILDIVAKALLHRLPPSSLDKMKP